MNTQHPRPHASKSPSRSKRRLFAILTVPMLVSGLGIQPAVAQEITGIDDYRSLDGSGNNIADPTLGQAGLIYPRVTDANYADGSSELVDGPNPRYLSNRIFNDTNQNIFSENGVTHWAFRVGPVPRPHLRSASGRRRRHLDPVRSRRPAGVVHQRSGSRSR